VPYCEAISEQLRSHARQALKAITGAKVPRSPSTCGLDTQ